MFSQRTQLNEIKNIAKVFLDFNLEESDMGKVILYHPFFESAFTLSPKTGELVDITEDKEALEEIKQEYRRRIDCIAMDNFLGLYLLLSLIRPPYHLVFLKYIKEYLTREDFSRLLGYVWTGSENPNGDVDVKPSESAKWFKQADKNALMEPFELQYLENLPDTVVVYRGVSRGRVEKGLSWTDNKKVAQWFRDRFRDLGDDCYLLTGTIQKEKILAYFKRRNEDELVINPDDIQNLRRV